jgi:hypothetical protein
MNSDTFFLIKVFFGIIAAIFTLSAAIFTFLDTAQNEKTEKTQAWFVTRWEFINKSRWLNLPENVARWLLIKRNSLADGIGNGIGPKLEIVLFSSIPILCIIASFLYWTGNAAIISAVLISPLVISTLRGNVFEADNTNLFMDVYNMLGLLATGFLNIYLWPLIIIKLDLYYAVAVMVLFMPFFWVSVAFPSLFLFSVIRSIKETFVVLFGIGVVGGFTATLFAMLIGHLIEPWSYVPQTLQMLIANIIFDGLTMAITFSILSWALSKDGLLRLPMAILLDIVLAGIFAAGSLYFGLLLTDKALTLREVVYILFARSADNSHFEFSPYFWVMHTTFIPTLLYLSLILFCWVGKALLIPIKLFFGLGQENKNPLKLTAGLCGIFAAVFTILFFVTGSVQERAKENSFKPPQPAVLENHN